MLDGIEDVDWASYHDAYGPAVGVPDDVRCLLSADSGVRADGLRRLYGNVFHQGTRYRASQRVVPFLVELASDRSVGNRPDIVGLIVHLAVGYPQTWLAQGFDETGLISGDAEFDAGRNEFHVDELDVYKAVCQEGDRLLRLCADEDPAVRHAIAFSLAFLPCLGDASLHSLAGLTETETDPRLRANALVSVSILSQSLGKIAPVDFGSFLQSTDPIVRFAAAVGQVRMQAEEVNAAIAILISAIEQPPEPSLYWNEGDLGAFAALTLSEGSSGVSLHAVEALCTQLQVAEGPSAERCLKPLLRMLFRTGPQSVPAQATQLSEAQLQALVSIAESPTVWTFAGMTYANIQLLLSQYGLPSSRDKMLAYLVG